MSDAKQGRCRLHSLTAAVVVALSAAAMPAAAAQLNTSGLQSPDQQSFDRFIVKYRDGSTQQASAASLSSSLKSATLAVPKLRGKPLALNHLRRMALGADVVRTDRKLDRAEAASLMQQLAADPNVEYVEVDRMLKPLLTPNDTNYSQQWGYQDADAGIRANEAWDITNGSGTVVAVLDTGIVSHSDLNANVLPGYDFIVDTAVSSDGNGRDSNPADPGDSCNGGRSSWHGTHVAGTVAAVTNNAKGVAGVAYGAKVVPVRVLGTCGGYTSDIADGIIWASGGTVSGVPANANPAEVINMSLGGSGSCDTTTQNAINGAVGRGTTIVVAAGNSNANASGATPANCANVITVGAVDINGARSVWTGGGASNYGATVDIAAPGTGIVSTLNSGVTTPGTENYASYNGTSMAAPHVAGVVALIQAVSATPRTPAQVETLIKGNARVFPSTPSQAIGSGIVDAKAAVDAARGGGTPPPPANTQTYTNGTDVTIRDNTTVESAITVSGRTGNAPSNASVAVAIVHTYIGDLKVDLVAPDGSVYTVHNRAGGSADNINTTYTVNVSSEALNGSWKLRVNDNANSDTGLINSWSITF